jgi:protein SCO1
MRMVDGRASRARALGRWVAMALFAVLAACEKPGARSSAEPLKKMFELPAFTLTERSGQPFDSSAMRGKVWVACFFFTSCPGPCWTLNTRLHAIEQATKDLPEVQLLSISTDEEDTPEKLRAYAKKLEAGPRWFFVTGEKDAVFNLSVKGFKLALADAEGVNVQHKFIHSTKLALIDRSGWIRGYYDGIGEKEEAESARLLADIRRLLGEK